MGSAPNLQLSSHPLFQHRDGGSATKLRRKHDDHGSVREQAPNGGRRAPRHEPFVHPREEELLMGVGPSYQRAGVPTPGGVIGGCGATPLEGRWQGAGRALVGLKALEERWEDEAASTRRIGSAWSRLHVMVLRHDGLFARRRRRSAGRITPAALSSRKRTPNALRSASTSARLAWAYASRKAAQAIFIPSVG